MSAFTPGPWIFEPRDGYVHAVEDGRVIGRIVVGVSFWGGQQSKQSAANAQLIAAAPALVVALKHAIAEADAWYDESHGVSPAPCLESERALLALLTGGVS